MMNKLLSLSDCRQSGKQPFSPIYRKKGGKCDIRGEKKEDFCRNKCFFGKLGRKKLKNHYLCTALLLICNRIINENPHHC